MSAFRPTCSVKCESIEGVHPRGSARIYYISVPVDGILSWYCRLSPSLNVSDSRTQSMGTHVANLTNAAIQELGWEVLPLLWCSTDLAPPDYHFFQSLSNILRGVSFNNDVELKTWLDEIVESRPGDLYPPGTGTLVKRWPEVARQ